MADKSPGAARSMQPIEDVTTARPLRATGMRFGRYVVVSEIRRGGMGVLLRAYDPRLQREVALESREADAVSAEAHERMLLEAQVMARAMAGLSHPNVVAIYDVEVIGGDVVIAMEHVNGVTLRQWLEVGEGRVPRSWREIVGAFIEAGQGLAAAHAAGLLHGNFDPENVLVGDDGRVRVTDFGIARAHEASSHGVVSEQHAGGELSPAADQYAFCMALFEALTGRRLLEGSGAELETTHHLRAPRWSDGLPRAVAAAIERGLNPVPEKRWPTMSALLDVLSKAHERPRARWAVAASTVAVLGMSSIAWAGWQQHRAQRCSGAQEQLAQVWNPQRRAEVEQAVLATGVVYAGETWRRVAPVLDEQSAAWVQGHRDACEATTLRGEQPVEIMDLRMACLHRAKVQLAAVVDLLEHADAKLVEKADDVVGSLGTVARCGDIDALNTGVVPPDEADEAAVAALRDRIVQAEVLEDAGKYAEVESIAEEVLSAANRIGYGPLRSEALALLASGHLIMGRPVEAKAMAEEILVNALRSRQRNEAARAAVELIEALAAVQRFPEAQAYVPVALGLTEKGGVAEYHLRVALSHLEELTGHLGSSETSLRAALLLLEKGDGPEVERLKLQARLGMLIIRRGRVEEGFEVQRESFEGHERLLGRDHPVTIGEINNFAIALNAMDRHREAEALYHEVIARATRVLGPDNERVGRALNNLGSVLNKQKRYDEAIEVLRRSLAFWENRSEPVLIANGHGLTGDAHFGAGRYVEAEAERRIALGIRLQIFGPDHPMVAFSRHRLGQSLHRLERHEESLEQLRLALPPYRATYGEDGTRVAAVRRSLAEVLVALRRHDEADAELAVVEAIFTAERGANDPEALEVRKLRAFLATKLARARKTAAPGARAKR